jgi:hypothetical protein
MQQWITHLERSVASIERDIGDMRSDLRMLRRDVVEVQLSLGLEGFIGGLPSKLFMGACFVLLVVGFGAISVFQPQLQSFLGLTVG